MPDLLELTTDLPEIDLAVGDTLVTDGGRTGSIWVLISGSLDVLKDGVRINTIDRPGAAFGEVAVLLGSNHSATVVAATPCRLRYARDGEAFLLSHPEILRHVAAGLAERLDIVTSYLADLRNQYAGVPGIDMVSDVLGKLVQTDGDKPVPGSRRDPDPEY